MKNPIIQPSAFVAPNATVIGDVMLMDQCSVYYNAVLRADRNPIIVGPYCNIQDGCILHVSHEFPVVIGTGCTIGHRAVLHGCTIGDNTLIGMGAIIMNGATVGINCIIGAGALITQNMVIPNGSLVLGSPAKVVRELTKEEIEGNLRAAYAYVQQLEDYKNL